MLENKAILICDDSPLVHKAMSKYLACLDGATLYFAENGMQAIDFLRARKIDVLFLDLTMPVMDGFEVLQQIPENAHSTEVIVLSADVQKQAIERCISYGANHFLPKPFNQSQLLNTLEHFGIYQKEVNSIDLFNDSDELFVHSDRDHYLTAFKEIANVALGRGAAIISDHFGEFIKMPLPNVAMLTAGELAMAINAIKEKNNSAAIAQRFVGGGIHGEALVCLHGEDIKTFGHRLGFSEVDEQKSEVVIDIANLMVSSFLVSLSEQMNIPFSVRQPILMEDYMVLKERECEQEALFTVEYRYKSELLDVDCDVLFMMDNNSTLVLKRIMETLY
ncbi:response regulator [Photobacterium nomapromontoriensis]|uniref:response regulator n=1 Tax=Photobacterium nomapromontoriensis TaxID=2910237 RepID=UPI003D09F89A